MAVSICSALPTLSNKRSNKNDWSHTKGNWALPWLCLQIFRSAFAAVSAAQCPGVLQVCARAVRAQPALGFLCMSWLSQHSLTSCFNKQLTLLHGQMLTTSKLISLAQSLSPGLLLITGIRYACEGNWACIKSL